MSVQQIAVSQLQVTKEGTRYCVFDSASREWFYVWRASDEEMIGVAIRRIRCGCTIAQSLGAEETDCAHIRAVKQYQAQPTGTPAASQPRHPDFGLGLSETEIEGTTLQNLVMPGQLSALRRIARAAHNDLEQLSRALLGFAPESLSRTAAAHLIAYLEDRNARQTPETPAEAAA